MTDETAKDAIYDRFGALVADGEYWAIFAWGAMGLRYGPYTAVEVGEIVKRAVEEKLPLVLSIQGGREIDWEMVATIQRDGEAEQAAQEIEA